MRRVDETRTEKEENAIHETTKKVKCRITVTHVYTELRKRGQHARLSEKTEPLFLSFLSLPHPNPN